MVPLQVRCFSHCSENLQIMTFNIPKKCPVCNIKLHEKDLLNFFYFPSPFYFHLDTIINGEVSGFVIMPFSILVKPTIGNFLMSYTDGDDLHIALTDSQANIYSFDQNGVTVEKHNWNCCLCIPIIESLDNEKDLELYWDTTLKKSICNNAWSYQRYNEQRYNCYHYVNTILTETLKLNFSKEDFCRHHILPEVLRATDYIMLYKEIQSKYYVLRCIP
ncbi:MKRN2 opposite strand protein isoform X3 [Hydra vulgaris]|uniref:MKRN2 opposite strand protein isoform X3 n=1 Tax=Hydra vulgaris TaxID=6087 RepID=A0ABM4BYV8_HYDVU